MTTIPKNSPYFTSATRPTVEILRGASAVRVGVDDEALRRAGVDGFDGMEKVFALLPEGTSGGGVRWHKVDLGYEDSYRDRSSGDSIDEHRAYTPVDAQAIREHGMAVGLETNRGTVWLQKPDDNWNTVLFGPPADDYGRR